jgi:hypothetical protein
MLLGVLVAYREGPRMGIEMKHLTPAKKRRLAVMLMVGGGVALLIVWALSTDHIAIGIGLLFAVTVLPEFAGAVADQTRSSKSRGVASWLGRSIAINTRPADGQSTSRAHGSRDKRSVSHRTHIGFLEQGPGASLRRRRY